MGGSGSKGPRAPSYDTFDGSMTVDGEETSVRNDPWDPANPNGVVNDTGEVGDLITVQSDLTAATGQTGGTKSDAPSIASGVTLDSNSPVVPGVATTPAPPQPSGAVSGKKRKTRKSTGTKSNATGTTSGSGSTLITATTAEAYSKADALRAAKGLPPKAAPGRTSPAKKGKENRSSLFSGQTGLTTGSGITLDSEVPSELKAEPFPFDKPSGAVSIADSSMADSSSNGGSSVLEGTLPPSSPPPGPPNTTATATSPSEPIPVPPKEPTKLIAVEGEYTSNPPVVSMEPKKRSSGAKGAKSKLVAAANAANKTPQPPAAKGAKRASPVRSRLGRASPPKRATRPASPAKGVPKTVTRRKSSSPVKAGRIAAAAARKSSASPIKGGRKASGSPGARRRRRNVSSSPIALSRTRKSQSPGSKTTGTTTSSDFTDVAQSRRTAARQERAAARKASPGRASPARMVTRNKTPPKNLRSAEPRGGRPMAPVKDVGSGRGVGLNRKASKDSKGGRRTPKRSMDSKGGRRTPKRSMDSKGGRRAPKRSMDSKGGRKARPSADSKGPRRVNRPSADSKGPRRANRPSADSKGPRRANRPSADSKGPRRANRPSADSKGPRGPGLPTPRKAVGKPMAPAPVSEKSLQHSTASTDVLGDLFADVAANQASVGVRTKANAKGKGYASGNSNKTLATTSTDWWK